FQRQGVAFIISAACPRSNGRRTSGARAPFLLCRLPRSGVAHTLPPNLRGSPEILLGRPQSQARKPIAMPTTDPSLRGRAAGFWSRALLALVFATGLAAPTLAVDHPGGKADEKHEEKHRGGEANLKLPDLNSVEFLGGIGGKTLLFSGLIVSAV